MLLWPLQASWALVKEERASVCIAAERVAMAAVPVEQAGQHCLRVCLHALAALCCCLRLGTAGACRHPSRA